MQKTQIFLGMLLSAVLVNPSMTFAQEKVGEKGPCESGKPVAEIKEVLKTGMDADSKAVQEEQAKVSQLKTAIDRAKKVQFGTWVVTVPASLWGFVEALAGATLGQTYFNAYVSPQFHNVVTNDMFDGSIKLMKRGSLRTLAVAGVAGPILYLTQKQKENFEKDLAKYSRDLRIDFHDLEIRKKAVETLDSPPSYESVIAGRSCVSLEAVQSEMNNRYKNTTRADEPQEFNLKQPVPSGHSIE